MILPVHQRLAELRSLQKKRLLTAEERTEFDHCLDANITICWKLAKLENSFSIAYQVHDTEWMHDCCEQIEAMQQTNPLRDETET